MSAGPTLPGGGTLTRYRAAVPQAESVSDELDRFDAEDDAASDYLNPGTVLRHSPFRNAPKVKTGLPTLDNSTEGGLSFGASVVVSGPPGSGKTTFMAQVARGAREQHGAAIAAAFYDEGTEAAALKLGQQIGLDYELLRSVDEKSISALEDYCSEEGAAGPFNFVPVTQDLLQMLENAQRYKLKSRQLVLLTDTLQKARFELPGDSQNGGERFRLERIVGLLRNAALTLPALNLMSSEVSRGAYASKDLSRRTTALAASAESRSIEYGCELLLVLSIRTDGLVEVEIAKNRLGRGRGNSRFVLRHDRERATYSEVDLDAAEDGDEERKREQTVAAWSADEKRVIQCVRDNPGRSAKMLRELLRVNMQRLAALLEELKRKGTLEHAKEGWFVAPTSSGLREDS